MAFDKSNIGKSCYINISNEAGIDDSSLGKIIGYYNESNEEYYFVSIIPDGKVIKVYDDSLINIINDGGSVTPEAIVDATGQMDSTQKSQMLSDLNAQEKITASGILKGDGNGGITAAVEGTDYDTPASIVTATGNMTAEQAAQTRQNIGADTPTTVTEWLEAHVDPDTGYVIDDSLTIQGAAADAKATGDAVGELKSAIEDCFFSEEINELCGNTINAIITSSGKWTTYLNPSSKEVYIDKSVHSVVITANADFPATASFVKTRIFSPVNTSDVPFSTGVTSRTVIGAGSTAILPVPTVPDNEDTYLVLSLSDTSGNTLYPQYVKLLRGDGKEVTKNLSYYRLTAYQCNMNGSNGSENSYSGDDDQYTFYRISSDFIPVSASKKYFVHCAIAYQVRIFYYTSSKTFISAEAGFSDGGIISPANDGYIRLCVLHRSNLSTIVPITPMEIDNVTFAEYLDDTDKIIKSLPNANVLKKPVVSVLGDSISTFADVYTQDSNGVWAAEGCHYTIPGNKVAYRKAANTFAGVYDPNRTWWMQVINNIGGVLGVNDAWAGSSVYWDGQTETYIDGANIYMASPTRINHLGENGMPDIILVFGGINDILHDSPLGTFDYTSPQNYTDEQIANMPVNTFADAYKALLTRIMKKYPSAMVYCILPYFLGDARYNPHDLDALNEIIKEAADYFGASIIDARTCGMNMFNEATYLPDHIHLNGPGMDLLAKTVTNCIKDKIG